jgi:hypothetical protein
VVSSIDDHVSGLARVESAWEGLAHSSTSEGWREQQKREAYIREAEL